MLTSLLTAYYYEMKNTSVVVINDVNTISNVKFLDKSKLQIKLYIIL